MSRIDHLIIGFVMNFYNRSLRNILTNVFYRKYMVFFDPSPIIGIDKNQREDAEID